MALFLAGGIASAINAVAGGGSLITFPLLVTYGGLPMNVANATNSVSLWPGSLGGAVGFWNLIQKTMRYFKVLLWPTLVGSIAGAILFVKTPATAFDLIVPFLILLAALLLMFQPRIKAWVMRDGKRLNPVLAVVLQFLVSVYGGYFGAGMGIMMLAAFSLYVDGTIHELNTVKTWLGLIINLAASTIFFIQGLVNVSIAAVLTAGALLGGYLAAKYSQKLDPEGLRLVIAMYGILMSIYFARPLLQPLIGRL